MPLLVLECKVIKILPNSKPETTKQSRKCFTAAPAREKVYASSIISMLYHF